MLVYYQKNAFPNHAAFEEAGFIFEDCNNDQLLHAILPYGWTMVSSQGYWKSFIDEKGRHRGAYLFTGLSNEMYLSTRYYIDWQKDNSAYWTVTVKDWNSAYTIFTAGKCIDCHGYESAEFDSLKKSAKNYLHTHFPEWENPNKYWD